MENLQKFRGSNVGELAAKPTEGFVFKFDEI